MKEETKQGIALARYAAIAPLVAGLAENYKSNREYYADRAEKGIQYPDGSLRHPSPDTIEKWYLMYRKKGFDALVPAARSDAGRSRRLDDDARERIRYLKTHYPRMSAAAIHRNLNDDGTFPPGAVSESTVCRFIRQMEAEERGTGQRDMRRYERPHINEVWCGDSSVGPWLLQADGKKRRVFIVALIDDASRFVTGAGIFPNDSFVSLMSVEKSAIAKYGRPKVFRFDNGKPYRNHQMELLAARIGTTLSYCQPYDPVGKSKIERWFRTMKDQWMAALDMHEFSSIDALRLSLDSYVLKYNRTPHSSLGGKTPQERFFSEPGQIRRIPEEKLDTDFLLEIERTVSADSVITVGQVEYEVDCRFARRRIRLRYSPDMERFYVVEADGGLTPVHLLNKQENAGIRRNKFHLTGGAGS